MIYIYIYAYLYMHISSIYLICMSIDITAQGHSMSRWVLSPPGSLRDARSASELEKLLEKEAGGALKQETAEAPMVCQWCANG